MFGDVKNDGPSVKKRVSRRTLILVIGVILIVVLSLLAYRYYITESAGGKKSEGGGGGGGNNTQKGLPPVARFVASSTHVDVAETVFFNASASHDPDGEILNYQWDFGDSTTRVTSVPETNHTYTIQGIYTVNLTVSDNDGLTNTTSLTIYVSPQNETLGPYGSILLSRENPIFPNSTSLNFTIQNGLESLKINISAVGLSYEENDQRIANATLLVSLYDPFLQKVYVGNYTYRGQTDFEVRPNISLLTVPGEYTLELMCLKGTTRVVFTVFINYTPL